MRRLFLLYFILMAGGAVAEIQIAEYGEPLKDGSQYRHLLTLSEQEANKHGYDGRFYNISIIPVRDVQNKSYFLVSYQPKEAFASPLLGQNGKHKSFHIYIDASNNAMKLYLSK